MKKIVNPGKIKIGERYARMFCEIEYTEGTLSISGVIGPNQWGHARGGCGQIIMEFKEYDDRGYSTLRDIQLEAGWDYKKIKKFFDAWDKWHLNDMQSACEHQQELGWTYESHRGMFVDKPRKTIIISEYDDGTLNDAMQVWNEFKGHLCPVCGYSIGSAWLKKEIPEDVIDFLFSLPNTKVIPAWV